MHKVFYIEDKDKETHYIFKWDSCCNTVEVLDPKASHTTEVLVTNFIVGEVATPDLDTVLVETKNWIKDNLDIYGNTQN